MSRCQCCNSKYECECRCDLGRNQFENLEQIDKLKDRIKELESELENLEKFAVKEFSLRVVAKSGEHIQKTEKFREVLQSFRQSQKERGEK